MNIILCGLPMSGKTTIGGLLAKQMQRQFIDTDRLIEKAYANTTGKKNSCRQIFQEEGESAFRQIEKLQIASLKGTNKTIIALGGGSLVDPENSALLKHLGCLVYLQTPLNILWQRIQANGIPVFLDRVHPEKLFFEMAEKRILIYETMADVTIDTNLLSEQGVASAILKDEKIQNGQ